MRIAIIGAGMGGLTAAATLRQRGIEVRIYEQATQFARVGAGIQQSANALRVLRAIGVEDKIRSLAFQPSSWANREWDSGEMKFDLRLGAEFEEKYGAPYLLMHRGDLHSVLASAVPPELIEMNRRLVGLAEKPSGVELNFEDGSVEEADGVIGADGVHSTVRELLLGPDDARFTGRVAYRTTFPAALLKGASIYDCTKWWGPDRHIVIYFVTPQKSEIYFVTSQPEPDWRNESWSALGNMDELRASFKGFHSQVQRVLEACPQAHKWALYERDPLPTWQKGRVVLLGDACHPMMPYMAQGATNAMEDAAVLARCLEGATSGDLARRFAQYEATRKPRTSRIQLTSRRNEWLSKRTDPDWVYGYDAWSEPLAAL